jgi:hypothetical protein
LVKFNVGLPSDQKAEKIYYRDKDVPFFLFYNLLHFDAVVMATLLGPKTFKTFTGYEHTKTKSKIILLSILRTKCSDPWIGYVYKEGTELKYRLSSTSQAELRCYDKDPSAFIPDKEELIQQLITFFVEQSKAEPLRGKGYCPRLHDLARNRDRTVGINGRVQIGRERFTASYYLDYIECRNLYFEHGELRELFYQGHSEYDQTNQKQKAWQALCFHMTRSSLCEDDQPPLKKAKTTSIKRDKQKLSS